MSTLLKILHTISNEQANISLTQLPSWGQKMFLAGLFLQHFDNAPNFKPLLSEIAQIYEQNPSQQINLKQAISLIAMYDRARDTNP